MADDTVYVRDQSGNILQGPASQLQDAIDAGATPIDRDEVEAAKNAQTYGGMGNTLAAAGIGTANMLTLGAGTGLAAQLSPDAAQYIQGVSSAHPFATHVGEAIGVVAPAILSGGSSLGADAADAGEIGLLGAARAGITAPTEALGALGGATEDAATGLFGDGMFGRTVAYGARGSVEGAILGLNQTYSDAEIDNHPLTADLLLAGLKKGALYGGGLGATLGLAGSGLGKLGDVAAEKLGATDSDLVGNLGLRAAGARSAQIRQLEAKGIDPDAVGRWIVDELPQYADKPFMRMSKEEMRDAATAAVKEAGEKVGSGIDELSDIAATKGAKPNIAQITSRVESEIIAPLRKLPGFEPEVNALEKYTQAFGEKGENATFADLNTFRKALDDKIFKGGKMPSPDSVLDQLRGVRQIIEDEAERQGSAVAGQDWLARYQGSKKYFGMAKEAERVATAGAQAQAGRNIFGLGDTLAGVAGFVHNGPLGIAGAALHHVAKEYGAQFVADMLNRAQKLQTIKAMAQKSDAMLDSGLSRFLHVAREQTQTAAEKATVVRTHDSFKADSQRINSVASNPQALQAHIAETVPPSDVAPRLGAVMAAKHAAALTYLQQQIPQGLPQSPLVPTVTHPPPRAKQAEWMQKHDVYKNPIGTVLKNLQKGTLTHAHVEALRAMYPDLYQSLQQKAMGKLSELGAKGKLPPFQKRVRLGLLLGIPADQTQSPSFVQSQQMLYAQHDTATSQSAGAPPPAPRNQRGARTSLASGEDELDDRA